MKNKFEIRGNLVAIFLNCKDGSILETIIDLGDLARAQEISNTWGATWSPFTKSFYVKGWITGSRGGTMLLHRWLMNCPDGLDVDHKNHDTLNNTRENLRNVTRLENAQNQRLRQTNNSGYIGVCWSKGKGKWSASICINGKGKHLGVFNDIKDAADVARRARISFMPGYLEKDGEMANVN